MKLIDVLLGFSAGYGTYEMNSNIIDGGLRGGVTSYSNSFTASHSFMVNGERSSNGGNGGRGDDDMVTPDPGEDRRLGCVPEYLDLSLADFTQIGDLNGDGKVDEISSC